jgi:hypothetical protein
MKAEQRHQLHTNALADRVGRLVKGMRSSPTSTSPLVWVFVLLALGTIGVWQYFAHASQTEHSLLWMAVDAAQSQLDSDFGLKSLDMINKEHEGTIPGRTAGFDLARTEMEIAQSHLNSIQRSDAIEQLKHARDRYEKLARQCADSPMLAQEALMGVATANESLVGIAAPENTEEDLKQVINDYKKVAQTYPDGYLGKEASQRAKQLEERLPQAVKFYEDFNRLTSHKTKTDMRPPEWPKEEDFKQKESKPPDVPKLDSPKPLDTKPPASKPSEPKAQEPKPQEPKPQPSKTPAPKAPEPKPQESKPPTKGP